jgi:hypothetical protein
MMQAMVTQAFRGCRDGDPRVVEFRPGDTVEGDLAREAVAAGWAEVKATPRAMPAAQPAGPAKTRRKR